MNSAGPSGAALSGSGEIQFITKAFNRYDPFGLMDVWFELFSQQVYVLLDISYGSLLAIFP